MLGNEEELLRSVALQNAQAVLWARDRAEREAIQAKQRVTSILESITDGFFALDREWRFTYLNRRGEEMLSPLRKSRAALMGKVFWEEFPETKGTDFDRNCRRAVQSLATVDFQTYFQPLEQWFEVRAYPSPDGLSVYFRDVTERHRAEEALRESEQRLRATFHQAAVGMAIASLEGCLEQVNARFCEILGSTPEEILGRSLPEMTHPDDRGKALDSLRRLVAGTIDNDSHEIRYVRMNGQTVWSLTSLTLLKDAARRPERLIGVVEDITQRKESEQLQWRLASVVESSDDAIISMGLDTVIMTWNRGAERMFGYLAAEAIGKSVTMLIPPDSDDEEPRILQRLLSGERIDHYETSRARKDGTRLNVSLTVSPIYDSTGRIAGVSKISRDITDRKRAEEALREAQGELRRHAEKLEEQVAERTARLRETIQELEAFSYSVSHDMRSPLRAMQGYSDALLEDYAGKLDAKAEEYLGRIRRGASRMDLLIQDVLAYSRVAKGEIHLRNVSVESVIRDVMQNYPALHEKGARLEVHSPIPPVIGHEAYLTQVVSNFLSNAVKFVAPGTTPFIQVRSSNEGEMVRIVFEDNGIGIAPEHHGQIFQIFGRVYSEKKFEGTGIGLAIAKKAAERMGGSIGVESQLGRGSQFFVRLKRAI